MRLHDENADQHNNVPSSEALAHASADSSVASFVLGLSRELPAPLATPPCPSAPMARPTPAPRRSQSFAAQPGLSSVRPSKRGELLLMRRLGLLKENEAISFTRLTSGCSNARSPNSTFRPSWICFPARGWRPSLPSPMPRARIVRALLPVALASRFPRLLWKSATS